MLSDERIIEIRDEHLPNQGEGFDTLAYARAIEKEARKDERERGKTQLEAVMQLNKDGAPEWLSPNWGGARVPGTKFYALPPEGLCLVRISDLPRRLPEHEISDEERASWPTI